VDGLNAISKEESDEDLAEGGIGVGGAVVLSDCAIQHQSSNKGVVTVQTQKWHRKKRWCRK